MASVTLAESAKLALDDLVAGVIENIITVNPMFDVIPFTGIDGNALSYNRENALGNVVVAGVGDQISTGTTNPIDASSDGKAPATFTNVTTSLTTIIGDAEVNGLIQATRSGDGNDQKAVQVASKAKHIGRVWQHMFINGTGAGDQFNGLLNLTAAGQQIDAATNGTAITFALLDQLIDLVTDKDSEVDYLCMNSRTHRSVLELLRGQGGAGITETRTLPSGREVMTYRQIPVFRNDYIPIDQTHGTETAATTVFAGTFDDGSEQHGVGGLTAAKAAGIMVVEVGEAEDKDESITRLKWYTSLANFSALGLAFLEGINN